MYQGAQPERDHAAYVVVEKEALANEQPERVPILDGSPAVDGGMARSFGEGVEELVVLACGRGSRACRGKRGGGSRAGRPPSLACRSTAAAGMTTPGPEGQPATNRHGDIAARRRRALPMLVAGMEDILSNNLAEKMLDPWVLRANLLQTGAAAEGWAPGQARWRQGWFHDRAGATDGVGANGEGQRG